MDDSISYIAREAQHYAEKQVLLERIYRLEEKYERAMENAKILSDAVTQLERERDAAIADLTKVSNCNVCKHDAVYTSVCDECKHWSNFEWRGLCKENGGIEG